MLIIFSWYNYMKRAEFFRKFIILVSGEYNKQRSSRNQACHFFIYHALLIQLYEKSWNFPEIYNFGEYNVRRDDRNHATSSFVMFFWYNYTKRAEFLHKLIIFVSGKYNKQRSSRNHKSCHFFICRVFLIQLHEKVEFFSRNL